MSSRLSKPERDHIRQLKAAEPFTGTRAVTRHGDPCKFEILGRGEAAFFQLGDRGLLFELLAGHGVLFAKSICRWDDNQTVTEEERDDVIEAVVRILKAQGTEDVKVVW